MALYTLASFTGEYNPSSVHEVVAAEAVIGHEFGAPKAANYPGAVNTALAKMIVERYGDKQIYASETIADAIGGMDAGIPLAGVFEDSSADTTGRVGGTWSELQQAIRLADGDLRNPIVIGQAFHAPRIAAQATKAGLEPVLPEGLPRLFDPGSAQWWCRGPMRWALREAAGTMVLRQRGQI